MRNPVLRVAFVAVIAILAMLYMASLLNKASSHTLTSTGAAYTQSTSNTYFVMDSSTSVQSPSQDSLITDGNPNLVAGDVSTQLKTSEDQHAQLAKIIVEPEPQQKVILAKEMSEFVPPSSTPPPS